MATGTWPRADAEFQFTPLREGRPKMYCRAPIFPKFQFTPLREGRPKMYCRAPIFPKFQFTPLREGRPKIIPRRDLKQTISIHAPA